MGQQKPLILDGGTFKDLPTGEQLEVNAGTAALPAVTVVGDPNTGIYSPGADQFAISTAGTQRVAFDSAGTVSFPATAKINLAAGAEVTSNLVFDSDFAGNLVIGATATIALRSATAIAVTVSFSAGPGSITITINNSTTFTATYGGTPSTPTVAQLITALQTGQFTSVTLTSGSPASNLPGSGTYNVTLTAGYPYNIQNVADPSSAQQVATKNYVDTKTIGAANGGSGLSSPTANRVLLSNGASAFQTIAGTANRQALTWTGSTWAASTEGGASAAATIGSTNNDYNPGTGSFFRITASTNPTNITGIAGGADGRLIYIVNVSAANALVLQNENVGSAVANRIITGSGADVSLAANGVATLLYDASSSRWRIVAVRP